ncbi:helix-turn-helix transcriptional regulator [Nocardioides panacisoli]|uniref:Helix-turn-helix transcriptional regulator n=1 Tax=Nocardioides panacisoli TaxID=627624 RepID=A0ABP7I7D4_9ACTN
MYAASGVLAVHTDGSTAVVPANRVAWTPSGVTHRHRAHGDTDMRIVFLAPELASLLPERPAVFLASALAREILLALTDAHGDQPAGPARSSASLDRLVRVLVDELDETHEQPLCLPEPRDDRLRAIADRLGDDPSDGSSLAELGRAAGASSRTLSRLFRDEFGMSFYEWRTQLRIYHALVLLAEGRDVNQTAHACGWSNPSSFIAAFTRLVGTSPGRHRTAGSRRRALLV